MGGLAQNVQKPPPGKNVQKSQGQIFQECVECQECQGQISQGQIPRSNPKVKSQGQIGKYKMRIKWENGKKEIQNSQKICGR